MASSSQDETVRLVLEVLGQQGLDALAQSIENNKTRLEALKMGYDAGNVKQDEFVKGAQKLTSQIQTQTGLLDKLKGAQDGAAKSSGNMGMALLQAGRGIQDFQAAGLMGIMNNIEGLTQAMGGGAGLAGALTAVAVGFYTLGPYIKDAAKPLLDFFKQVDVGATDVERLKTKIHELEEKPVKLAVDEIALRQLEERVQKIMDDLKAADAWRNAHTDWEKESGQAVASTLANAPGGAAMSSDLVETAIGGELERTDENVKKAKARDEKLRLRINELEQLPHMSEAEYEEYVDAGNQRKTTKGDVDRALNAVRERAKQQRGDLYKRATAGDAGAQREIARLLRQTGQEGLAGRVERLSPGTVRDNANEQSQLEAESRANAKAYEQKLKDDKAAAAAEKKKKDAEKAALDLKLKNAGKADEERRKQQEAEREAGRPRIKAEVKKEDEFADRSGLVTEAGFHQARLVAQGATWDQAYDRTHQYVQQQLQRRYGIGAEAAWGQAHRITGRARDEDADKHEEAFSQAIHAGANVNQATIYANQQLLQTMAAAVQQLSGMAGTLRQQGRRASSMRVKLNSFAPIGGGEG